MVKKLTDNEITAFRDLLRQMLSVLNGDIDRLEQEALDEAGIQSTEGGTDVYAQEFSLQLLERDESTLREVLDALERIQDGRFGVCEACSTTIRRERLRAVPFARNCIDCQRNEENNSH